MDEETCAAVADNAERVAVMLDVASDFLWRRSGYQWPGVCTDTIRPVVHGCGFACCDLGRRRYPLPVTPVVEVTSVIVDGVTLDPSAYRIDTWGDLVRTDGEAWPCCQDLALATSEEGTWQVTFKHGALPPPSGVEAVKALACHLAASGTAAAAADCVVPPNATGLDRQGVSFELVPLNETGGTGIELVDRFIDSTNPNHIPRSARVRSPHAPPARVTT